MFDFRYHALSLVSVFLALVIGLLLGVAIGDKGLVSSAEHDVRASLRADVRKAQKQSDRLRGELGDQQRFAQEAYPLMVGGRLSGERIGLVSIGAIGDEEVGEVRDALEQTGGQLTAVAVIRTPLDLPALSRAAAGTLYEGLDSDPALAQRFGERIGAGYLAGEGRLLRRVRRTLLDSSSGTLGGVDAVVLAREPRDFKPAQQQVLDDFAEGLVAGLTGSDHTVVGIETTDTDPSQVGWYRKRKIASVDDVDQLPGRAALVFALAGADGAYGTKSSADALLPKAAETLARANQPPAP
jgi:hypothetical protein